jgi:hypothetical protein
MSLPFSNELEKRFFNRFNERKLSTYIEGKRALFSLSRPESQRQPFDFYLRLSGRIVAIIEVKSEYLIDVFNMSRMQAYAVEHDIRLIILTDGIERFDILDLRSDVKHDRVSFDYFTQLLLTKNQVDFSSIKDDIASIITRHFIQYDDSLITGIPDLANQITNQLSYDEIDQRYYILNPTGLNSIESKIFLHILGDGNIPERKIYRYTTLSTAYSMLSNNSFRMNCLVGMNDMTEVDYVENYINGHKTKFISKSPATIKAYNNRFISSCSLKEDDLTQWRLYADDSKGVCLVLNINKLENDSFIVKKISYGEKDGSHKALSILKDIIAEIKIKLGIDFYFKSITTWRHFFKPYEYAVEEEVRILYIRKSDSAVKKGWLLTATHNILNPYVDFELNSTEMPVTLTEIVLGPKCPEKELNKCQFKQFINELRAVKVTSALGVEVDKYNLKSLKVSISSITSYR